MRHFALYLLASKYLSVAFAWSAEEFALYDLVEEVAENFYEFFGVPQDRFAEGPWPSLLKIAKEIAICPPKCHFTVTLIRRQSSLKEDWLSGITEEGWRL
ncbi:unnamed protein product [Gongylonema pulchrum]|uniref:Mitoguardin 1 n=1 Tax=Gongylonema pulchrum TaxID=637853 RepID=A0A183DMZ8_9BILA|nr:unnamed protein product [Gongylonema pulchrum]